MKKVLFLMVLIIALLIPGCGKNNENKENDDETTINASETIEFDGIYWREDLAAVAFLGFNEFEDLNIYAESQEFSEYLEFYFPEIKDFEIIDVGGDELFFIIPRFLNSNMIVQKGNAREDNNFIEEIYYEGKAKPVLLQTNVGEVYPDTDIFVSYKNKEVYFSPFLSGMDLSIVLPEYGVLDISPYYIEGYEGFEHDIYLLEGSWNCKYTNPDNEEATIDLQFENLQSFEEDDWYEMIYWKDKEGSELRGNCYFRVPVDFKEPIDDEELLLYFDLAESKDEKLNQFFGKFYFEFIDSDTLILRHVGYDPLNKGEENFEYIFNRTFG